MKSLNISRPSKLHKFCVFEQQIVGGATEPLTQWFSTQSPATEQQTPTQEPGLSLHSRFKSSINFLISSTFQAEVYSGNFTGFGYLPSAIPLYQDDRLTGMMPGLSPSPMMSQSRRTQIPGKQLWGNENRIQAIQCHRHESRQSSCHPSGNCLKNMGNGAQGRNQPVRARHRHEDFQIDNCRLFLVYQQLNKHP